AEPAPPLPRSVLAQVTRDFGRGRNQAGLGLAGLGDDDLPPLGGLLDQLGEMGLRLVQAHGLSHRRGLLATTHGRTLPHLTKLVKFTHPSRHRGSSSTPASHTSPAPPTCTPARAASSSLAAGPTLPPTGPPLDPR